MKIMLIKFIKFYRKYISPNKRPCCRFIPTCSEYSLLAIEKYGAFKGSLIAIKRIIRCNPFSKSGYDPLK
ncbi:MAG: membrane protein insertion efficiency factor YidD [Oscillospiraceae bacterium]|nr:membrane protein insertion efficiency factor YidD [Oscillospiraceae bacterium]